MSIEKGDVFECEIESLAFGGSGLARVDGMAVFVRGGIPGEHVRAEVVKKAKRFAEARKLETLVASPHATEPRCDHFGECGGCVLQHFNYEEQLRAKSRQVSDALARIGGLSDRVEDLMQEPLGSPDVWNYRNKMEFAFEGEPLRLGLRAVSKNGGKGRGTVLNIEQCHLCSPEVMHVLQVARKFCIGTRAPSYNVRNGRGFWRHLVVRSTGAGKIMVHLITENFARHHAKAAELGRVLAQECPGVCSFVHSIRMSRKELAFGEQVVLVQGDDHLEEVLDHPSGPVKYSISPNSFFQTNTGGAARLFNTVREMGGFTPQDSVLDLYCGTGGIGLFVAGEVREVTGFELSEDAVADARKNAKLNGLDNCRFVAGSLENGLAGLDDSVSPDVVICDPPRSGMHEEVVNAILELEPKRVVAVSCDPATLARDISRLSPDYAVSSVRAVDLFPHTQHIETMALLERS